MTAEHPTLPASDGVKNPFKSPPMTTMKMRTGQNTSGSNCILGAPGVLFAFGAMARAHLAQP